MTAHLFVDESKRRGQYLVAAVLVPAGALARVRTTIRGDLLRGQRRIHFSDEKDVRRKQLLRSWLALRSESVIVVAEATKFRADAAAREACLTEVVAFAEETGTTRLVLEWREGQDHVDRRLLSAIVKPDWGLAYEHLRPHEEPILWYADGVAWCWGAGGTFRQPLTDSDRFHVRTCG